ncbi:hypothetical protein [Bacillus altitudinis]|uniref:hypothetical protein n=1 Tax=Bacillus altitudinis TaxID=293387 RepID=UPI00366A784C
MAVSQVTDVVVQLDKPRRFVFDLNAFIELEDVYGSKDEAVKALKTGKLKHVRAWFWAGLVHEDRSLTVEDVGRLFSNTDPDTIVQMADEILKAATSE